MHVASFLREIGARLLERRAYECSPITVVRVFVIRACYVAFKTAAFEAV